MERVAAHASRIKQYADESFEVTKDTREQILYDEKGLCVDRILRWRHTAGGVHLRVRWLGFEACDDTWEPLETFYEDVPEMIQEYVNKFPHDGILQEAFATVESRRE